MAFAIFIDASVTPPCAGEKLHADASAGAATWLVCTLFPVLSMTLQLLHTKGRVDCKQLNCMKTCFHATADSAKTQDNTWNNTSRTSSRLPVNCKPTQHIDRKVLAIGASVVRLPLIKIALPHFMSPTRELTALLLHPSSVEVGKKFVACTTAA